MGLLLQAVQAVLVLLVERAHRIDEYQENHRGKRAVHVAKAPRNRNQRQVDEIGIERCATNRTHDRDAKNF